jgi:malate synthase
MATENTEGRIGAPGVEIRGAMGPGYDQILTPDALGFVAALTRELRPRLAELMAARVARQARFDAGEQPRFLEETRSIRESDWTVSPLPADLLDRRVEITGPVDRKMIINALNSGASVFMADFEDSSSPTFANMVEGQQNLYDAVRRTIDYVNPDNGKQYSLGEKTAVLLVRPRGLHLPERHVLVDGHPVPGPLFDFGLYLFHNAKAALERGTGPYFYLPKLQSHLEARWWNDAFVLAQQALGIPRGTIKATVLIETLPGAFEMDEILYELREHSSGLNCGRWDYIFSFIKTLREDASRVLPDRAQVGMTQHCMAAYTQHVIKTCHRRKVHAMGGMAAQIPIKGDPAANEAALAKVRVDKLREVQSGHDGTWVAHPALVGIARSIFDEHMPTPNQIARTRDDVNVTAEDLLTAPTGTRTEAGVRQNVNVGILYLEAWLRGSGCVPLYNLMEDAATAEISRTQIWQWIRHGAKLDDGRTVTAELFEQILAEELGTIRQDVGVEAFESGRFAEAAELFDELSTADTLADFLTLPAYDLLVGV